jgi:hypothetical protein
VLVAAAIVVAVCLGAHASAPVGSFVLPGVDPGDIDLEVGRWCRYLIVDAAEGITDSSTFYVAVLGRRVVRGDDAYWIEIETGPRGAGEHEREVTRALVSGGIKGYAYGDSLYRYVYELYIKKGNEPVEAADPLELKRLTLAHPTSETDWKRQSGISVPTPTGSIVTDLKEMTVEDSRRIPTGRVTLVRHHVDTFRVWSSREVPIFSLVKCVIERSRESKTVPAVPGIPDGGTRESKTTVLLTGFGSGAKPLLDIR